MLCLSHAGLCSQAHPGLRLARGASGGCCGQDRAAWAAPSLGLYKRHPCNGSFWCSAGMGCILLISGGSQRPRGGWTACSFSPATVSLLPFLLQMPLEGRL